MSDEEATKLLDELEAARKERDDLLRRFSPEFAAEEEEQKRLRHEIAGLRAKANLLEKKLKPKPLPASAPSPFKPAQRTGT